MLERFHVPEDIAVKVDHKDIFKVVENIFLKMGMSKEDAFVSADVLIYADVRGIESHGVSNMLRRYVQAFAVDALLFQKRPKLPLNCLSNHLTHDLVSTELALHDSPFLG